MCVACAVRVCLKYLLDRLALGKPPGAAATDECIASRPHYANRMNCSGVWPRAELAKAVVALYTPPLTALLQFKMRSASAQLK